MAKLPSKSGADLLDYPDGVTRVVFAQVSTEEFIKLQVKEANETKDGAEEKIPEVQIILPNHQVGGVCTGRANPFQGEISEGMVKEYGTHFIMSPPLYPENPTNKWSQGVLKLLYS